MDLEKLKEANETAQSLEDVETDLDSIKSVQKLGAKAKLSFQKTPINHYLKMYPEKEKKVDDLLNTCLQIAISCVEKRKDEISEKFKNL